MPHRQSLAPHSSPSNTILPARDRHRAWQYIVIAYLLGALVVFAGTNMIGQGIRNEEQLSLVSTLLSLLVLVAGLPVLILLWRAVARSGRAARMEGTATQHRLVILATALYIAASLAAAFVLQSQLQRGRSQAMDRAVPSMFDRSGLVVINRRAQQYRNMNDRCSGNGVTPPSHSACGAENRPPCVTQQWLVAHNAWPLVQIGDTPMPAMNPRGALPPGVGVPGASSPILRPRSQDMPPFLFIARGGCYLEYRRVQ